MKNIKRLLSLLIALTMILGMVPLAAADEGDRDGWGMVDAHHSHMTIQRYVPSYGLQPRHHPYRWFGTEDIIHLSMGASYLNWIGMGFDSNQIFAMLYSDNLDISQQIYTSAVYTDERNEQYEQDGEYYTSYTAEVSFQFRVADLYYYDFVPGEYYIGVTGSTGEIMLAGPFYIFEGATGEMVYGDGDHRANETEVFAMDTELVRIGDNVVSFGVGGADMGSLYTAENGQIFRASETLNLIIDGGKPPMENSYNPNNPPTVMLVPGDVVPPYNEWNDERSDPEWFEKAVDFEEAGSTLGKDRASGFISDVEIAKVMFDNDLRSGEYRLMLVGKTQAVEHNYGVPVTTRALSAPFTIKWLEGFTIEPPSFLVEEIVWLDDIPVIFDYGNSAEQGSLMDEFKVISICDTDGNVLEEFDPGYWIATTGVAPGEYTATLEFTNQYYDEYFKDKDISMEFTFTVTNETVDMATAFPDDILRAAVYIALEKEDGDIVTQRDLRTLRTLDASNKDPENDGITNLAGFENFYLLEELDLSGNKISDGTLVFEPQVSNLVKMNCSNMGLTELSLEFFHWIEELDCSNNNLTVLDISNRNWLTTLDCSNNNLQSLDVSECTALVSLDCRNNDMLEESDITGLNKSFTTDFSFDPQNPTIPTSPSGPYVYARGTTKLTFRWSPSTSRDGVEEYEIYRDDVLVGTAKQEYYIDYWGTHYRYGEYTDSGLALGAEYTYKFVAVGKRGGKSEPTTEKFATADLAIGNATTFESSYILGGEPQLGIRIGGRIPDRYNGYTTSDVTAAVTATMTYTGRNTGTTAAISVPKGYTGTNTDYLFYGYWIIEELPADTYDIYFTLTDPAEDLSVTSPTQTVILLPDSRYPVVNLAPGFSPNAVFHSKSIVTISGSVGGESALATTTFEYRVGDGEYIFIDERADTWSYNYEYTLPSDVIVAGGVYDLTVRITAVTKSGNETVLERIYKVDAQPPAPVSDFSVTATPQYIELMWSYTVTDADFNRFDIYREDSAGNSTKINNGKTIGKYEYVADGIVAGQEYSYYVVAVDNMGNESAPTETLTGTLPDDSMPPTFGSFTPSTGAELCRTANIAVTAIDNYQLSKLVLEYRELGSGTWLSLGEVLAKENSINEVFRYTWDLSALSGSYELQLSVHDAAGNVPAVRTATYTVKAYIAPVAPVLTAQSGQHKSVPLSWTYAGDEDSLYCFRIYRGGTLINTVAKSTFTYTDTVANDIEYSYTVVAVDRYGATATSDAKAATAQSNDTQNPVAVISPEELIAAVSSAFTFSAALSTDNDAIAAYAWSFGDGGTAGTKLAAHSYAAAGTYTVTLTVTDDSGNVGTATAEIEVLDVTSDEEYTLVTFNAVDASASPTLPVGGTTFIVKAADGTELKTVAGADGAAEILLENGTYTVSTLKDGYLTRTFTLEANGGLRSTTVGISKVSLVTGELTVTEMTYDEIVDAGIDAADPDNQHVSKVEVVFEFGVGLTKYELPVAYYKNEAGELIGTPQGLGYQGEFVPNGVLTTGDGARPVSVAVYPISEKFFLVIYGEARWLKEMYNVELVVINNSNTDSIENCVATLEIPQGLSLAAMLDRVQSASIDLGTIETADGNNKAVANWYIRGDTAGEYNLNAKVTGTNAPIGDYFEQTFTTTSPLKVYAGDALELTITAQPYAYRGGNYRASFKLENVSDKALYNLSFGITGAEQYQVTTVAGFTGGIIWNQTHFGSDGTVGVGVLNPGESIIIDFETPVWFTSIHELGAFNVSYLLKNVFVTTLEGSTTQIPYRVIFGERDRQSVSLKKGYVGEIVVMDASTVTDEALEVGDTRTYELLAADGGTFVVSMQNAKLASDTSGSFRVAEVSIDGAYTANDDGTVTITNDATLTVTAAHVGEARVSIAYNGDESYTINCTVSGEPDDSVFPDWSTISALLSGYVYGDTLGKITLPTAVGGEFTYKNGATVPSAGEASVTVVFTVTADVTNKDAEYEKTFNIDIAAADYSYTVTATQTVTAGGGISALAVPAEGIGVNDEAVSGTLSWFTDSAMTQAAADADISSLASGAQKTLYFKFTPQNEPNYVTTPKTGAVALTIVEGAQQALTFGESMVAKTYGDGAFSNTATNSSVGGAVTYESSDTAVAAVNAASGAVTIVGTGSVTITASAAAVPGEYSVTTASYTLNIGKKAITVTADNKTRKYGEANPILTFTYTLGDLVGSDTAADLAVTLTCAATEAAPAGTPIAITGTGASANYQVTVTSGELTITKADAPTTVEIQKTPLFNEAGTLSISLTAGLPQDRGVTEYELGSITDDNTILDGTPIIGSDSVTVLTNAGIAGQTAVIPITVKMTNYADATFNIVIVLADFTRVTVDGVAIASKTYDGSAVSVTGSPTASGGYTGAFEYKYTSTDGAGYNSATAPKTAGGYQLVVSVADADGQFAGESAPIVFTIGKAALTVKPTDVSIYNGDALPAPTVQFIGLKGGDTGASAINESLPAVRIYGQNGVDELADSNENGTFVIRFATAPTVTSTNYTVTIAEGRLTIAPKTSGSGGIPSAPAPSVPSPSIHVGNEEVVARVEVDSSDGIAAVPAEAMAAAIQEAVKAAKSADLPSTVEIHVNTPSGANELSTSIPTESVKAFADSAAGTLKIVSAVGEMTIDSRTVDAISAQASGANVEITFKRLSPEESLNERQRAAVGDSPVYDISITSGSKYIGTFGGTITISLPYALKAGQSPRGVTVWYLDENGNVERVKAEYDAVSGMVTFAVSHLSLYLIAYSETAAWINPFTDVSESSWFYPDVAYVAANGLFNGTGDTTFSPQMSMTRGMVVTVLGRLAGIDIADYSGESFDDVSAEMYYAPYVKWAAELGIVNGVGNNNYAPDANISRQDLALILNNYADKMGITLPETTTPITFNDDADIRDYAKEAVSAMQKAGIITGKPNNTFDPQSPATRAEVAAILHRLAETESLTAT